MKKRIIFVGMNNKEGRQPLCSSTRSGKLIDKVIAALGPGYECVKTNLYDIDTWPEKIYFPHDWVIRSNYLEKGGTIVGLGESVHNVFHRYGYRFVKVAHPATRSGGITHSTYIERAVKRIKEFRHEQD